MAYVNYLADITSALDDLQGDYRVMGSDCNVSGLRVTLTLELATTHGRPQNLESLASRLFLPRMTGSGTVQSTWAFAPPAPE